MASLFGPKPVEAEPVAETSGVSELERILALPRRPVLDCSRNENKQYPPETQALVEYITDKYARPKGSFPDGRDHCICKDLGHPCITQLKAEQAWILYEAPRAGGIHGYVGVGAGKSIASLLVPLAFSNCKTALLLAKSTQRLHYREHYLRLREHFRVPSIVFDDGTSGYIVPGSPVLHFFPYSRLQRPESTVYLESLNPDTAVLDESHLVARPSSRTNRTKRYFSKRNANFCHWSGSLVKKGICDTSHLAAFALKMGSPQPIDPDEAAAVGAVVDPSYQPDRTSSTARALRKAFAPNFRGPDVAFPRTQILEGLQQRIVETEGVISTRAHSVDCSLYMYERKAPEMPEAVKKALAMTRGATRPDGEELAEAMEIAKVIREVACGFYNHWVFKKEDPIELIESWFSKRKRYFKELRGKLEEAEPYLDSPQLCYHAAERAWRIPPYEGPLPTWKADAWPDWDQIKDKLWHDSQTAWVKDSDKNIVGDWLAKDAAEWAKEHHGIVWTKGRAFGQKIAQIADIPYFGGGPKVEAELKAEWKEWKGKRSIVCSIPAHGESRDGLQHWFNKQLVCELPASGDGWEQLLGRLCRQGQKHDEVETWVYLHVSEFKDDLRRAIELAEFIQQATRNSQWLAMADKDFKL